MRALVGDRYSRPNKDQGGAQVPVVVFEEEAVQVNVSAPLHGRAVPAFAYRFDTADGSVVCSGDTAVYSDLIAFVQGPAVLVHSVAELSNLEGHGTAGAALERTALRHTDVCEVAGADGLCWHFLATAQGPRRSGSKASCRDRVGR